MLMIDVINTRKILSQISNQKMNGNLSYGIMKFIKNSSDDEEFFISEMKKIINEYAQKNELGEPIQDETGNIKIQVDLIDECNKKIQELNQTEVKSPWVFKSKDICSANCFSPQDLFMLDCFIED